MIHEGDSNSPNEEQIAARSGKQSAKAPKATKPAVARTRKASETKKVTKTSSKTKAGKQRKRQQHTKVAKAEKRERKTRTVRPYPLVAFNQATKLGEAIHQFASGEKVRRLTLLEKMKLSPSSSGTVNLINNSSKYKITTGSYIAEYFELTGKGKIACDPSATPREKLANRFDLV